MVQGTCDLCGRILGRMEPHYIASVEVRPTIGISESDEDAGDRDHLLELHEMLETIAEDAMPSDEEPTQQEFILCHDCCCQFRENPLPRESSLQLDFSEN